MARSKPTDEVIAAAESELGAVNIAIEGGSDTSSKDHTLNSTPTTLHNERHSHNSLSTKTGRDNGEPADGQRWSRPGGGQGYCAELP